MVKVILLKQHYARMSTCCLKFFFPFIFAVFLLYVLIILYCVPKKAKYRPTFDKIDMAYIKTLSNKDIVEVLKIQH